MWREQSLRSFILIESESFKLATCDSRRLGSDDPNRASYKLLREYEKHDLSFFPPHFHL